MLMAPRSYIKDCEKYLKGKKIASVLRSNNEPLQTKILACLDSTYKGPFLKEIFYPYLLVPPEVIAKLAEKSFTNAISSLFEEIKQKKDISLYNNIEEYLLGLFKDNYHILICTALQSPDITPYVSASLLQMNNYCRDCIIWHYIDNFTIGQVGVITGKSGDSIKKELWNCRENLRAGLGKIASFVTEEIITEQQFYILIDYFAAKPLKENTLIKANQPDDNIAVQKNSELELLLRYQIDKKKLLESITSETVEPFASADEFIEHVKQTLKHNKDNNSSTEIKS